MVRSRPRLAGSIAAVAVAAAAASVVAAVPASARTPHRTSVVSVVVDDAGMHVSGPLKQRPGRLHIRLTARDDDGDLGLIHVRRDYSFERYRSDVGLLGSTAGNAALRRINSHIRGLGGLYAGAGKTVSMTTERLPAGKYVLYDFSGALPRHPHTIVLSGDRRRRPAPETSAVVTMTDGMRFRGDTTLPSHGTILVRNRATTVDSPHVLFLQRVAPGTTRAAILEALRLSQPLSFLRPAQVGTDALAPGTTQTLHYRLPAGTYAELCLYPSLEDDGLPGAFGGMVRIVEVV